MEPKTTSIEQVTQERDEARAACAAMRPLLNNLHFHMKYWGSQEDGVPDDMYADWKAAFEVANAPDPGQPIADELAKLRQRLAESTAKEFKDITLPDGRIVKFITPETMALIDSLRELETAFQRSPYDVSPCHECGEPTVCLPDGMAFCEACAEKEEEDG